MEAIKDYFNPDSVGELSERYRQVDKDFRAASFRQSALQGLTELEYRRRVEHIALRLWEHFDSDYNRFCRASLPVLRTWATNKGDRKWVFTAEVISHIIQYFGLNDVQRSLQLMEPLTEVFTAEWCIRPFVDQYPEICDRRFQHWLNSTNEHHRRLVSEGTRPHLPWGQSLQRHRHEPGFTLPLLEMLLKDPSVYVQKSVANHLNDLCKQHSDRILSAIENWSREERLGSGFLMRQALRNLIKEGHPDALRQIGVHPFRGKVGPLKLESAQLKLGETLRCSLPIRAANGVPAQAVEVDFILLMPGKTGKPRKKIFKGKKRQLQPGEVWEAEWSNSFKKITTRNYYSGSYTISPQVNGKEYPGRTFHLSAEPDISV